MAKYPGTLETNNINEFGIVFADQIQGHRSVSNLDSLYKLTVAQLSKSKNNNGNDAIGQEWYVISESKKYKLIDWTKRNQTGGWEAINNVSEDEFNKKLNELEQKIVNNIDWKETVNTFADIATTYPNPQDGWTVSVKDTNKIYRYDAESKTWIPIFENTTELATASRNGLMSATYAKKLDGIEAGANKYIHPTSHPATIITQDSTHRFVTDAEKTLWNKGGNNPFPGFGGDGSANTASRSDHTHDYTTIKTDANHRWITDTLLTKLNGIETGANKYIHPSTHPATIITQDSTHRFVTDTEKTTWNNKADANHTHSVVETANRLTQYNLTNQDLNTIKGSDYYNKFFYAAGGEATTNKPSDVNAYGLIVLRSAGGHTTQLLTSTNLNTGLYWRGGVNDNLGSWKKLAFITDNVASATKLLKPRTINGTNFDGSVNITTSIWGTTRNITIGNTKKTVNGSADVAWSLTEIGAAASNHNHDSVYAKLSHTHTISQISDRNTGWDALLKAAPSGYVTRWPSISEVTSKQNLLINLNGGTTEGTNQFTYNATAAKTINITAASIGAAASSHTHPLSQISDLHSSWDALLKASPSGYVTRWPSISEVTAKQNLLIKLNGGTTEGTNQFTYNATAAKTINITAASIGAAASSHNHDSVYAKLSHTHPLSQISDLHSSWDAVLKAQYQSPTVDTTKLVKNSGTTTLSSPTWDNGQVKIQFGLNFINIGFGNGSYYTFSTLENEAEHLKFYNIIDKKFYRAAYLEKEQTWSAYQDFASGAGNSGSDMRFKVNIKPFENVLDKIKNLEIIEYKWNKKGEERDTFGLNATQIKKLFPKMWHQRQDKEKTEWLEYDRTGVIALKAIQELINENNSLKNDIEYLKKEIQNLKNK